MTQKEYAKLHFDLLKQVVELSYFVELFDEVKLHFPAIESEENPDVIANFWNAFWASLPDDISIHTTPFYDICDMCADNYVDVMDSVL